MQASGTGAQACENCGKSDSLKHCAKCKSTKYCSHDCQKAQWKAHKKVCTRIANANNPNSSSSNGPAPSTSASPKAVLAPVYKPFHKLEARTWLHDRPETDVYSLLLDTFRLRLDDNYKFGGENTPGSVYAEDDEETSLPAFRKFLRLAEGRNGLLPSWWSPEKAEKCVERGTKAIPDWFSLQYAPEKDDISDYYNDMWMPMQMRMFGEQVYGRGPGGESGAEMREMMMQCENGDFKYISSLMGVRSSRGGI
ncbi:hypothetical protein M8818_007430 [Zalaria obscura]|uniref:Uncharacterized protein n=1 Tax=Zalaria obscura TaxID=2024903 RepID=A0ACC3S508_9PEZI